LGCVFPGTQIGDNCRYLLFRQSKVWHGKTELFAIGDGDGIVLSMVNRGGQDVDFQPRLLSSFCYTLEVWSHADSSADGVTGGAGLSEDYFALLRRLGSNHLSRQCRNEQEQANHNDNPGNIHVRA